MKAFTILFSMLISLLIKFIFTMKNQNNKLFQEEEILKEKFNSFKTKFSKKYTKTEEEKRFLNYKENHSKAKALNQKAKVKGKHKEIEVFGETPLFDLSDEEFQAKYLTLKIEKPKDIITEPNMENFGKRYLTQKKLIPNANNNNQQASFFQLSLKGDQFDWRVSNVVGPVRNQSPCGSCWAFAATGVIESQYSMYNGQFVELSKQQLVDCDLQNQGCTSGTIQKGIDYIVQNGAMTELSYPYLGYEYYCVYSSNQALSLVSFYDTYVIQSKIDFLRYVIQNYGPVAAAMNAQVLKYYTGGIIDVDVTDCDPLKLNHGILIIGFGIDSYGDDYWIVKNYWGAAWGDQGFFKITAKDWTNISNPYGVCGINSFIVTVKLK